jgi:hypothetical protein
MLLDSLLRKLTPSIVCFGQAFAMQVEIDQGEVRAERVMVLRDATIGHPVEAEDAFQDVEHMF